jgi:hypothetical protein
MPTITIITGLLLIVVGVGSRLASDTTSLTIHIPTVLGVLFVGLGLLARRPELRKHVMHAAAALALLAVFGSLPGLLRFPALLAGQDVGHPLAVIARSLTAVIGAGFVALAVRSFIAARRARQAAASGTPG